MTEPLALLGFASGIASNNGDCGLGPWYLNYHPELFTQFGLNVYWHTLIQTTVPARGKAALSYIEQNINELASVVLPLSWNQEPFCVIGGDHSSAIGTWSAVAHANRRHGDIGLIWIDAHMDSHTHLTTKSHNVHGMPLAHLLGEGMQNFCQIFDAFPKLKPKNCCLIGVRSYEDEELQLLNKLGVSIFFIDEVHERGINAVLSDAYIHVSQHTCGVGLTIDMDAIDPLDAPGVGCPEPNGINGMALVQALKNMTFQKQFLGLELAEFNPIKDINAQTAKLLVEIIHAIYK